MDFIIVYKSFFYLYISLIKKQCAQSTKNEEEKNLSGVEVPENYDQGAGPIEFYGHSSLAVKHCLI